MYMSNGQLSLQTKYTLFIKQAGFAIASIYSNIGAYIMRNTIGNKMKNKGEEKKWRRGKSKQEKLQQSGWNVSKSFLFGVYKNFTLCPTHHICVRWRNKFPQRWGEGGWRKCIIYIPTQIWWDDKFLFSEPGVGEPAERGNCTAVQPDHSEDTPGRWFPAFISRYVLGASEITANLYCNCVYLYREGCVIFSIYLR